MLHIFTNAEYVADMLYIYSFCGGSPPAAVEECSLQFPIHRIPDCRVFSKVFNTLRECGMLPSAHVSSEQAHQQHVEEQENILQRVQHSSTTRHSTRLGVS